ncbi:MAG TPA: DinB family protein [Candidatus Dormibacteraeota bacterium]|nr:DinB family protein [Candidatus Dormibacteraeota bacterium]
MAATTSPNPVADARAYQQMLVSLLGKEDPADVQAATEAQLRAIVRDAGPNLRRRPAVNEWSVLELLGHLADGELVASGRYRWAISHDRPALPGYDQDQWVERLHHNQDDPDELLTLFATLRASNLALWKRSSGQERERVALHAERGPESVDLMFRMLAGHDRFHLNQMRETLRQVGAAG